jgi:hypothetical protein
MTVCNLRLNISDMPLQAAHHQRVSVSSTISLAFRRDRSALYLPSPSVPGADGTPSPRYHPAPSRNEIAVVQPVLVSQSTFPSRFLLMRYLYKIKGCENDILTAISFLPRYILTSTKSGHIKLWIRPLALKPRSKNNRMPDMQDLT